MKRKNLAPNPWRRSTSQPWSTSLLLLHLHTLFFLLSFSPFSYMFPRCLFTFLSPSMHHAPARLGLVRLRPRPRHPSHLQSLPRDPRRRQRRETIRLNHRIPRRVRPHH